MTTSGATGIAKGDDVLAAQPRPLIVTVYGLFARESADWFSIASLIRLMAGLGVDEPAVRSAISRLKQRGMLEAWRRDGVAGYGLSSRGSQMLAQGDRRIFQRPAAAGPDGWLIVVFSVPEQERARRHLLRSRLTWLGFGTVAAGVWIAPAQLAGETRDALAADDLSGYVSMFMAGELAFGDISEKIGQWWDLDRLEELYQAFIDAVSPVLAQWQQAPAPASGARAFADYVRVLTAWRRLPFLDPGLPAALLPPDWHGARAVDLFLQFRALLEEPARAHVRAVLRQPPK
jgi:phenylacetic acid degradation operon negative regulatory protein